ncbi:6-phospho-3-hexuloisomerase [Paenibacillus sp. IB182496]|uniref:6-phospho-3-hexuloisomerase n=1 Tax=Paenibacillus sabuli TaxID=2772509 RepID=A0A927BYA8_9BACL|nr:6-phospho-3-hexuloisomerase [Paenibacillus sabuli]MBD2847644.1 6-phospho-3-hexuloisomerase [Paenibacillus sabuli]
MNAAMRVVGEVADAVSAIDERELARLVETIDRAGAVFVAGAGRSGLMGRALAMRLMHLGLRAYVVGETITPAIGPDDLLLIGSGSGETASLVGMADKAGEIGAAVAVATTRPESTLARKARLTLTLPGSAKEHNSGERGTIQPMASLFEQTLLLAYDAAVICLMERRGMSAERMYGSHANLE